MPAPQPPTITVELLTPQQHQFLEQLACLGIFGDTAEEAAQYLLTRAICDAWRDGLIGPNRR
jgi:hypothetical protein